MVLNFSVKGNKLVRKDMKGLVAFTRNNAFAGFDFDREWADVRPVTAQFYKNEECCYDVFIENGRCEIPWEVLEGEGNLKVTVMGGDLIITNSVEIRVYESGLVGGLVPTKASPGVYGYIVEMAEEMEEKYGDTEGIIKDSEAFKGLQGEVDSIESCVEEVKGDVAENKGAVEEISKRVDGVEVDVEGLSEKINENENSIEGKINKKGDSLDGVFVMSANSSVTYDELGEMEGYTVIKKNTITTGKIYAEEVHSNGDYIRTDSIRTSGDVRCEEVRTNYLSSYGSDLIEVMSEVDFDNDVVFSGNVKFENRCIENVTDTNITAEEGKVYVYSKAMPVSGLNITLSGVDEEKENVFKVRFTAGADNMNININESVQWIGNSVTEAGKAYCLCIYAAGEYIEAELRG